MSRPGERVDSLQVAEAAWGPEMPVWVRTLAEQCNENTQTAVAQLLGRSTGFVNQIIANKYGANLARAEAQVRAVLLPEQINCPVIGNIDTSDCLTNADRAAGDGPIINIWELRFKKTCPTCPHNPRNS